MCLVEELQRISGQKLKDVLAICIRYLVGRSTFELKVIKPGAFRFDYIATQAGQSSAGMRENGCLTRRREEAESFQKKHMKVTSVAWQLPPTGQNAQPIVVFKTQSEMEVCSCGAAEISAVTFEIKKKSKDV